VTVFERYWNSPLARGAAHLSAAREAKGGLATLRQELELTASLPAAWAYLGPLRNWPLSDCLRRTLLAADASAVRVVADPPSKAKRGLGARRAARVAGGIAPEIAEALRAATREALIISPYFVPGDAGLALLCDLARRGVHVSVVTNALAATDVVAVHGGYARYRRRLLAAGIELHELRPSGVEGASLFGSRGGASLHTKALAVDGDTAFVGSFNLDHRSAALNTEMGVLLRHPALACQLREEHARLADPARSWRAALDGSGRVVWHGLPAEGPGPLRREPGASLPRRIVAGIVRWLPIESQL
jgi:putative cardiolipin synthase